MKQLVRWKSVQFNFETKKTNWTMTLFNGISGSNLINMLDSSTGGRPRTMSTIIRLHLNYWQWLWLFYRNSSRACTKQWINDSATVNDNRDAWTRISLFFFRFILLSICIAEYSCNSCVRCACILFVCLSVVGFQVHLRCATHRWRPPGVAARIFEFQGN